MTTETRPIVFVDLDGTLVLRNSFHLFLERLWSRGSLGTRLRLCSAGAQRVLARRGGRLLMKRKAMSIFEQLAPSRQQAVLSDIAKALTAAVSPPVKQLMEEWRGRGATVVLATAAPRVYAEPFAVSMGCDGCLATPSASTEDWGELLGEAKARACLGWLASGGFTGPVVVVTDHEDDLPLMRIADEVVIHASPTVATRIEQRLPATVLTTLIDPSADQLRGGAWLWIDGRLSGPHDKWELRTIMSKHRYALVFRADGTWERLTRGSHSNAALREEPPRLPEPFDRLRVAVRRRLVRDKLGIYH